ncbi:MAG: hypothetical protein ACRDN6_05385 [Gaiellaceae bacterium]
MNDSLPVPRLTLRAPAEAAEAIGVSADYFDEHVRPELRLIRRGRKVARLRARARALAGG